MAFFSQLEIRVFYDSKDVAEKIFDCGYFDAATHVLNCLMIHGAKFKQTFERRLSVFHAPVSNDAFCFAGSVTATWLQAELITSDIKPYIKRFIKIWPKSEYRCVPVFGFR